MGYAIMRMAKLKSEHELGNRYNHDMRIYNVRNADPLKASQNEELVDQLIGRTYADISDETIRNLQQSGAITKKIRKDAVRGLDIFLGFSHEDTPGIDINAWSKRCVEWLQQTFNPPGGMISYTDKDGMEVTQKINNVKSVVLHMDESTPHIHAFIVPIDEYGHLNAKAYSNGRTALGQLQDSYAQAMEPFGLSRGERHSTISHQQRSAYYNKLLQASESTLPDPAPNESLEDYHRRAEAAHQISMVHQRDSIVKEERKLARRQSILYDQTAELAKRKSEFASMKTAYEQKNRYTEQFLSSLAGQAGEPDISERSLERISKAIKRQQQFDDAVKNYPDKDKAKMVQQSFHELINWQREREKKETSYRNVDH